MDELCLDILSEVDTMLQSHQAEVFIVALSVQIFSGSLGPRLKAIQLRTQTQNLVFNVTTYNIYLNMSLTNLPIDGSCHLSRLLPSLAPRVTH